MSARVVVLGAGSAGCVIAARLSERRSIEVVLVEAGPDYPDFDRAPEDVRNNSILGMPDHDWGYVARSGDVTVPMFRGKVVGGSSAVNATNALRALAWDFQRWEALGNPEWSWPSVLDTFVALEADEAPGGWHGTRGPVPIRRYGDEELRPVHRAFIDAATALGHSPVADLNGPSPCGVGPIPMNREGLTRMTTARTHLTADVRARTNLQIRSGATVDRLVIRDGRVVAAVLASGERIDGDAFVLAAGSIGSPAILLRSGIGPADEVAAPGVDAVADVPGVGRGLREHPAFLVAFESGDIAAGADEPIGQTILTASSGLSGDAPVDLHVIPLPFGGGQFAFMVCVVRPEATGSVRISSGDADDPPIIDLSLFGHDRDLAIGMAGVRVARALARTEPLASFLGTELAPGPTTGDGDEELRAALREAPSLYWHASCTCRMGPADDRLAVVDGFGRMRAVDHLWVIDASIFPDIPSVPTNMTTMMVAERCTEVLRKDL